jgi:hypothetical protein
MIKGLLSLIKKAKTPGAVRSAASEARQKVLDNPRLTGEKEKNALSELTAFKNKLIDDMKKKDAAATKPKGQKPKDPDKRRQSTEERQSAATGNVSGITTTQKNKKEGVGSMVAYTSMERGKAVAKAGRDLRAGNITEAEHKKILDAIAEANKKEVDKASIRAQQRAADAKMKPVSLAPPMNFKRGGKVTKGHVDMRKGGLFY